LRRSSRRLSPLRTPKIFAPALPALAALVLALLALRLFLRHALLQVAARLPRPYPAQANKSMSPAPGAPQRKTNRATTSSVSDGVDFWRHAATN
jgi:hypothetical protein